MNEKLCCASIAQTALTKLLSPSLVQELQNSILDQIRRLQEATDEKATLAAVQRQVRAEVARAQDQAAAAREEAARKGRELASTATALKVMRHKSLEIRAHQ